MNQLEEAKKKLDQLDYDLGQLYISASHERKSYSKQIHLIRLMVVKARDEMRKLEKRIRIEEAVEAENERLTQMRKVKDE